MERALSLTSSSYQKFKWEQWDSNPQPLSLWSNTQLNGWAFVSDLSDCGFESRCSHINFRYGVCLEFFDIQANYRVQFHSETRTWHDNNIQSAINAFKMDVFCGTVLLFGIDIQAVFPSCISLSMLFDGVGWSGLLRSKIPLLVYQSCLYLY